MIFVILQGAASQFEVDVEPDGAISLDVINGKFALTDDLAKAVLKVEKSPLFEGSGSLKINCRV
jgi:hypothetical protein